MTKNNQITVNASGVFATKSTISLDNAQSNLRTSLHALNTVTEKAVSALQASAMALTKVIHAGAGEEGLKQVPTKPEINDLLKVQIEAVAVDETGTKNVRKFNSLTSSSSTICQMTWCILAGHFVIGWSPKDKDVWIDSQKMKSFKHNPNIHTPRVFRLSCTPFPKFKDNGNVRTNSPDDMVPVTKKDTENTFARYMLQKKINADQTGFEVAERNGKIETVANSKEAMTATLGLTSWFKNQAFVDNVITDELWNTDELDGSVRNSLFDALIDFSKLIVQAKTVADAVQAEEKVKADETKGDLTPEAEAKLNKTIADMTPAPLKVTKKLAKEIAESNAKSAKKSKAKVA